MSDRRKVAHLGEQLGEEQFAALIDSGNTGKVKEFCAQLLKDATATTMTVGGRIYEILGFLKEEDRGPVRGKIMVKRAEGKDANLGQDDGQYLLDHQEDIHVALRGKIVFVFPGWRHPADPDGVAYVDWLGYGWTRGWLWLGVDFHDDGRVLRRK